ncbi:MAG TPA: aldo/keto reductase [Thermoplasmata archaeon]|nr:aldo/keto reductase [Thermoplasmata archaeon]
MRGASISRPAEKAETRIPYRALGRTGERVSAIGLGGFHLGKPELPEAQAIRIIRTAIDAGLNFLDNSWDYNGGASERRMGKALEGGYRERAFLMTKIDGQTKEAAAAQIDESLRRLRTDVVDLLQFHEIIRMGDPDRIFAEGGALEAALDARDAGRIRFIGFTGHKSPAIHRKMLETAARHGFRFDTVQMPLNVMDAHFQSFEKEVLPLLVKEGVGVLGMKPLGDRQVPSSRTVGAVEALHYAMNLPTSVVITGCDSLERLEQALQAARTFRPMTPDEVKALLDKTTRAAKDGAFERYKTTRDFDSTVSHPEWLG